MPIRGAMGHATTTVEWTLTRAAGLDHAELMAVRPIGLGSRRSNPRVHRGPSRPHARGGLPVDKPDGSTMMQVAAKAQGTT